MDILLLCAAADLLCPAVVAMKHSGRFPSPEKIPAKGLEQETAKAGYFPMEVSHPG
jgi:hypothetical protein